MQRNNPSKTAVRLDLLLLLLQVSDIHTPGIVGPVKQSTPIDFSMNVRARSDRFGFWISPSRSTPSTN